jgi:hypothetical protein
VFGVTDKKTDPVDQRLVGLPPDLDFPEHFGAYPQRCTSAVQWEFRQPALLLPKGNVMHVVQIPRSWNAPHFYRPDPSRPERWRYPKRTDKGTKDMSYEEVRMVFLQYYEKRLKLQLLRAELDNIASMAGGMIGKSVSRGEFSLTVLGTVLADTYTILASSPRSLADLGELRNTCRLVNREMQIWINSAEFRHGGFVTIPGNVEKVVLTPEEHKNYVYAYCTGNGERARQAIKALDELLSTA